ncbi:hypothetical protein PoMZ_06517 [Pyricularia oryzae]|uniref:Uncharacterized protein n=1 Tax=Pyricularia oryzae TaxID=318829 RepID=A0A4P7NR19_PYROR|nr:hypothetical protein PoMZ_06517 [Pyricularia oryzae]
MPLLMQRCSGLKAPRNPALMSVLGGALSPLLRAGFGSSVLRQHHAYLLGKHAGDDDNPPFFGRPVLPHEMHHKYRVAYGGLEVDIDAHGVWDWRKIVDRHMAQKAAACCSYEATSH